MTKSEIRSFVKGLVRGISVEERARFSEALKEEVGVLEKCQGGDALFFASR